MSVCESLIQHWLLSSRRRLSRGTFIATFSLSLWILYHSFHQVFCSSQDFRNNFLFSALFRLVLSHKGSLDVRLKIGLDRLHRSMGEIKQNKIPLFLLLALASVPEKMTKKFMLGGGRKKTSNPSAIHKSIFYILPINFYWTEFDLQEKRSGFVSEVSKSVVERPVLHIQRQGRFSAIIISKFSFLL